jgi:hypothetical protein
MGTAGHGFPGIKQSPSNIHPTVPAKMLNKILVFLICPLLLISFGDLAMANGYDDARAGIAELNKGNNAEAIRLLTRALDSGQIANGDLAAN